MQFFPAKEAVMQSFDEEKQRALDRAFRSLAARAHTEKEIADKLARAG